MMIITLQPKFKLIPHLKMIEIDNMSAVFNLQDNEFDNNKLTNLDSMTLNRYPLLD